MKIALPIVCLLIGLGAGYLLFHEDAGTQADGPLTGDPDTQRPADPAALTSGTTLKGRAAADPIASALQAVRMPEREVGTGVIHGRVTDRTGQPVAGVHITLSAIAGTGRYAWLRPDPRQDPDAALLQQVRQLVDQHRWGRAYRQVTTTDDEGRYRFEGVTQRRHTIHAHLEGWQCYPTDRSQMQGVFPDVTVDLTAVAMARLRLEVSGPGAPTSLYVELRRGGSSSGQYWAAAQPILDVQPGTWDVWVRGGAEGMRAGPYPVTLEAGVVETLVVELEPKPVLRLHLKYAPDEVMPLYTYIMPRPPGDMPTDAVLRARGKQDMRHWLHTSMLSPTAREHVQTFDDLGEGTYVVGVARDRSTPIVHIEEIAVRAGVQDHTVEIPPLDPADYVIVGAYGPDGALVQRPQFVTGYRSSGGSSSGGSQVALRSDGRYVVMHHVHRGATVGADATYFIEVRAPDLGTQRIEYVPGRARELRVDFGSPATVTVEVKGAQGTPYEGRLGVTFHPESKQQPGLGSGTKADKEGRLVVRGLQPGEYLLRLTLQGSDRRSHAVAETPYTVKAGEQATSIGLPPLYTLTARGGAGRVSLSSSGRSDLRIHQSQTADADGAAVFDGLPAGTYRLRSGRLRGEVTLPGPSDITLKERSR